MARSMLYGAGICVALLSSCGRSDGCEDMMGMWAMPTPHLPWEQPISRRVEISKGDEGLYLIGGSAFAGGSRYTGTCENQQIRVNMGMPLMISHQPSENAIYVAGDRYTRAAS